MAKTGIVILHWNNTKEVRALLTRLQPLDHRSYLCLIVDNSQDFPSKQSESWYHMIRPDRNLGFAAGCNLGMREAFQQSCDSILLLNADIDIDVSTIVDLKSILYSEKLGAVAPVLLEYHRENATYHVGGRNPLHHSDTRITTSDLATLPDEKPDYLPGTVLFIDKKAIDDVGYFDAAYFFSGEVADWCLRLKSTSWKIAVASHLIVRHHRQGNENHRNKIYLYYSLRNRYLLIRKFGGEKASELIKEWSRSLRRQMLGALARFDFGKFLTIFRAVKDGMSGQFGQYKSR